jgi:hypothetical protein
MNYSSLGLRQNDNVHGLNTTKGLLNRKPDFKLSHDVASSVASYTHRAGKRQLDHLLNAWLIEKNIQLPKKQKTEENEKESAATEDGAGYMTEAEPYVFTDKQKVWLDGLKSNLFDALHEEKTLSSLVNRALKTRY